MKIKIESYEKDTTHDWLKSDIIWANGSGASAPILHIRKPKWLSQESYDKILEAIEFDLNVGFEILGENDE